MIIINKAVGSLRISDIQYTLTTKQMVKISDYVDKQVLERSLLAPRGNLYMAKKDGLVQIVHEYDNEYKRYEERILAQANFYDPNTRVVKMREGLLKFHSLKTHKEKEDFIEGLGFLYYDFFIELRNKLISPEHIEIKKLVERKINSFKDQKIAEGFVLLDFS